MHVSHKALTDDASDAEGHVVLAQPEAPAHNGKSEERYERAGTSCTERRGYAELATAASAIIARDADDTNTG